MRAAIGAKPKAMPRDNHNPRDAGVHEAMRHAAGLLAAWTARRMGGDAGAADFEQRFEDERANAMRRAGSSKLALSELTVGQPSFHRPLLFKALFDLAFEAEISNNAAACLLEQVPQPAAPPAAAAEEADGSGLVTPPAKKPRCDAAGMAEAPGSASPASSGGGSGGKAKAAASQPRAPPRIGLRAVLLLRVQSADSCARFEVALTGRRPRKSPKDLVVSRPLQAALESSEAGLALSAAVEVDFSTDGFLGAGGFAAVYKARPRAPGGGGWPWAAKLILKSEAGVAAEQAARREAFMLSVHHPRVVSLLGLGLMAPPGGRPGGRPVPCLLFPLGESFQAVFERVFEFKTDANKVVISPGRSRTPFHKKPPAQREPLAAQFALQLASGLSFLHDVCCIRHGDVKPDNVLCCPAWPGGSVRIADLGGSVQFSLAAAGGSAAGRPTGTYGALSMARGV